MRKILVILAIFIFAGKVYSFNPITHMWLGLRPEFIQLWRDFGDPEFADSLESSTDILTKKFYLIGMLIPDIIDTFSQYQLRTVIRNLRALLSGGVCDPSFIISSPFNLNFDT